MGAGRSEETLGRSAAASTEGGGSKTTQDVLDKDSETLCVPIRTIDDNSEGIVMGFRQQMVDIEGLGGVATGAGLGTDFIQLQWGDRSAVIRGSDLLRTWVATFAPDDAARFPESVRQAEQP